MSDSDAVQTITLALEEPERPFSTYPPPRDGPRREILPWPGSLCPICFVLDFKPTDLHAIHRLATASRHGARNTLVYQHYPSIYELQRSAAAGCKLCRLLWNGLREPLKRKDDTGTSEIHPVVLYLSTYRTWGARKDMLPLEDQHITVECGPDRAMTLDIFMSPESILHVNQYKGKAAALRWRSVESTPLVENQRGLGEIDLRKVSLRDRSGSRMVHRLESQRFVGFYELDRVLPAAPDVFGSSLDVPESDREDNEHTGSLANLKLAAVWLKLCVQTHGLCTCTTDAYTRLPRRLIYVGSNVDEKNPYLYESNGQFGRYATLSHRWPKILQAQTTRDTIDDFKKRIPWSILPQTFRDAITVCRTLGVTFLWIDSLCIIQDSKEDWEVESAQMGNYYWNSFFNIAAAVDSRGGGFSSEQGCFQPRDPCGIQPCHVRLRYWHDLDIVDASVHLAPHIARDTDWRFTEFTQLDSRAWILQERILAPRTLFFGEHQISFSCLTMRASEACPHGHKLRSGLDSHLLIEEYQHTLRFESLFATLRASCMPPTPWRPALWQSQTRRDLDSNIARGGPDDRAKEVMFHAMAGLQAKLRANPSYQRMVYDQWYDLVTEYNCRCITIDTDVLPAVSGIASYFNMITGDRYLAGLWEADLIPGLLWSVDFVTARPTAQGRTGVPSWSWASLRSDTLTMWYLGVRNEIMRYITVLDMQAKVDGPNRFGTVSSAHIHLQGYLKRAVAKAPVKMPDVKPVKDSEVGTRGARPLDKMLRYVLVEPQKERSPFLHDGESGDWLAVFAPDWAFLPGSETLAVWLLPILQDKDTYGRRGVASLAVLPNGDGTWRRVGFARLDNVDWFGGAELQDIVLV